MQSVDRAACAVNAKQSKLSEHYKNAINFLDGYLRQKQDL